MLDRGKDIMIELTVLGMRWMNGEERAKLGRYKTATRCVSHCFLVQ